MLSLRTWWLLIPVLGLIAAFLFTRQSASDSSSGQTSRPTETQTTEPKGAFSFGQNTASRNDSRMDFPVFSDVHQELGLRFRYDNWARGVHLMVEATGGVGAWLDVDSDGFLDAVFPQGCDPTGQTPTPELGDRLFRSLDALEFLDITDAARLDSGSGYGQGIAVGDFNNDGFDDIYLTRVGSNRLFENQGDGTFVDVTDASNADTPLWSTSAAWADWDCDGDVDLFVCNYVDFDVHNPVDCRRQEDGVAGMCSPNQFNGLSNAVFVNEGNGHFRESALELGLVAGPGITKSLGVVIAELTGDEWPDIFVANDETANTLFVGQDGSSFHEDGYLMGCAVSRNGEFQASMGIAFGDFDRNGLQDLCLTHFYKQSNTLYASQPAGGFVDVSRPTGLTDVAYDPLGFGTVMQDFNQDGHQDMFVANGHVHNNEELGEPFKMRPQLLSIDGHSWRDAGSRAGPYFDNRYIGRGVSAGDFDRDGDFDLLVGHHNDEAALLRNDSQRGNWLKLHLIGTISNRRGIGAKVTLIQANQQLVAQIPGGTSYCATQEPVLIFGIGDDDSPVTLEIGWPNGRLQRVNVERLNRVVTVVEPVGRDTATEAIISLPAQQG